MRREDTAGTGGHSRDGNSHGLARSLTADMFLKVTGDVTDECLLYTPVFSNSLLMSAVEASKHASDLYGLWPLSITQRYDKFLKYS